MTDDLVKRLREEIVLERLSFGCVSMRRNPDGLEAADRIEQLEAALREKDNIAYIIDGHGITHESFTIVYRGEQ
jgi:hypothetical protein